jgi:hypothetical protein
MLFQSLADLVDEEWLMECTGTSNLEEVCEVGVKWGACWAWTFFVSLYTKHKHANLLSQVDRLTLKIDTNLTTIERIGSYLPALHTLVLSNSRIASIRDLGTSLSGLMRLELSQW